MVKKRKIFSSILCIILALLMILSVLITVISSVSAQAVSQSDIDALKEEQSTINAQQEALQSEIAELEEQEASVLAQKLALDQQNELARQEIELISEQIDIYDNLVALKAAELEEALAVEQEQTERFRARMRAMEEQGTLGYLAILFQATSFSDLLSRLDTIGEVMAYDNELEEAYIASREEVETLKAEYEEIQAEQEATKVELLAKQADLENQIENAYTLLASLANDIDAREAAYADFVADEARIEAEITEMIAELERQEEEAQAAQAAGGVVTGGGNGTTGSTGTYYWPLPGYSPGSAYGWRMHPIWHEMRFHSGEDIGAPSGTPIYAADGGTVTMAGLNGGYGNCVMINHGNGRVTLYAHMSSFAVSVGQTVNQAEVIGYVGSTGVSTGPHLHFEVRINGSTTDPKQYTYINASF